VARSQWQIRWLLASGQSTTQVTVVTGSRVDWIRVIAPCHVQHPPNCVARAHVVEMTRRPWWSYGIVTDETL
jgi:hypothetical protein